jgi:hypothetical protein
VGNTIPPIACKRYIHQAVARNTTKLKDLADKGAEIWTGAIEKQDFINTVFTNSKAAFILTPDDTVLDPTT